MNRKLWSVIILLRSLAVVAPPPKPLPASPPLPVTQPKESLSLKSERLQKLSIDILGKGVHRMYHCYRCIWRGDTDRDCPRTVAHKHTHLEPYPAYDYFWGL